MLSHGSIENFFLHAYDAEAADISGALESFSARAMGIDLRPAYGSRRPRPGVGYFFSRPSCGGACKRLNLFLRWMVRHDAVDFGLWRNVSPAKLIVPLDTHVIRVGRCLRLTRYTSPGWRMAADITASLREMDPADPVKYDFSLCHLGMADQCGFNRAQADSLCPLRGSCHPRPRGGRRRAPGTAERFLDHPLGAEHASHPYGPAAPMRLRRSGPATARRWRPPARGDARRHEQSSFAVLDDLRDPPVSLATVALDSAMASSSEVPALRPGLMTEIKLLMNGRMSARKPGRRTCLSTEALHLPFERRPQVALAEDDEMRVRDFTDDRALRHRSGKLCPFSWVQAATAPTMGACVGSQNSAWMFAASSSCTRCTSIPSYTVTIRSGSMPSSISVSRMALDAARTQSTWWYFQRENVFPLR
jgi:hypothetical protein